MGKILNKIIIRALFIVIMHGISVSFAQENNQWRITVDADMPYVTNIRTLDSDGKTVPFLHKVQRIWDESYSGLPYNAFTDIIHFRGEWYCAFREGEIHGAHESGRVRIIRSPDGDIWKSAGLFEWNGGDVRDTKLSITAEGNLMVNSSIYFMSSGSPYSRQSVTWLSPDGEHWSSVYACPSGINTWRWSVTWHNGVGYSIGYTGKDAGGTFYSTFDGKSWNFISDNIFPKGMGNEASIVFDKDDSAYCLLRDGPGGRGQIGIALSPYTEWNWKDLGMYAGGPKLVCLKDGRLLAVIRNKEGGLPLTDVMPGNSDNKGSRTSLCWIDPQKGVMKEFLALPSGGSGGHSYAGVFEHNGMIWISYYSSHENESEKVTCSIYLAKVKLAEKYKELSP